MIITNNSSTTTSSMAHIYGWHDFEVVGSSPSSYSISHLQAQPQAARGATPVTGMQVPRRSLNGWNDERW